jgi:pimeloyl-ACP methyl ester carboxylesterase
MFALMNTSSGAQNRIGAIASGSEAVPGYPFHLVEVDGIPISISVSGPVRGSVVVMLTALPTPYDAVCHRLHIAVLRTVVIVPDRRMNAASVVHILDLLGVQSALLVGDWAGGELAWELSATRPDRFTGFVVIDVGHPRVADLRGVILNDACPPVGINTTTLAWIRGRSGVLIGV